MATISQMIGDARIGHALRRRLEIPRRWQSAVSTIARLRSRASALPSTTTAGPFYPWNGIGDALAALRGRLTVSELLSLARRRTGLHDFGEEGFEAPLELLLRSYDTEANLSTFGRLAPRWDTLRFLQDRGGKARLEDYGLDATAERNRYRDYRACFNV